MSNIPSIVNGPSIGVKKKIEYDISCPKCSKDMRITGINEGTLIECKECGNITWCMSYNPPWWAKTSNFIFSILLSIVLSLIASWLFEIYYNPGKIRIDSNPPPPITKER